MQYKILILEILTTINKKKTILSKKSLYEKCNVTSDEDKKIFDEDLHFLIKKGILYKTKAKRIGINKNLNLFLGICSKNEGITTCLNINEKISTEGTICIPDQFSAKIMPSDVVLLNVFDLSNKKGSLITILDRKIKKIVGTFIKEESNDFAFVVVDDKEIEDIYVKQRNFLGAKNFDKVEVEIINYPTITKKAEGSVLKVLGFKIPCQVDYLSIAQEYGFQKKFHAKTIKQVEAIPDKIDNKSLGNRLDLTKECIFTVDCVESKDLDDAVSIKRVGEEFELGVHIADVTHYVKEDTALDKEALSRGTSVYMIDKVLPMLPKKLSNNLCSLNPNEVKLTLSVFMLIDKNGKVNSYNIKESYICSKAKLDYTNVSNFLENNEELMVNHEVSEKDLNEIKETLVLAKELCFILQRKRTKRGALNFEFDEAKISLNNDDVPISVKVDKRRIANKLIEEFMIATNEVVAEHFFNLKIPFIYRIHEKPKLEKISNVFKFIEGLGYELPNEISNISLQKIINNVSGSTIQEAVSLLLLQSMQQAKYYEYETGHFGLASDYYSHFTSPIRRYPDLAIHRIIKLAINNKLNNVMLEKYKKRVSEYSKISSKKERQAQNAEIEYEEIKKAEYMQDKIGQTFEGMIISINKDSCKVMLKDTITGVVDLRDFNYNVNQENISLISETGVELRIGAVINVKLIEVSVCDRLILFDVEEEVKE